MIGALGDVRHTGTGGAASPAVTAPCCDLPPTSWSPHHCPPYCPVVPRTTTPLPWNKASGCRGWRRQTCDNPTNVCFSRAQGNGTPGFLKDSRGKTLWYLQGHVEAPEQPALANRAECPSAKVGPRVLNTSFIEDPLGAKEGTGCQSFTSVHSMWKDTQKGCMTTTTQQVTVASPAPPPPRSPC